MSPRVVWATQPRKRTDEKQASDGIHVLAEGAEPSQVGLRQKNRRMSPSVVGGEGPPVAA